MHPETIAAVATPPGPALRAVLRISGPAALSACQAIASLDAGPLAELTPQRRYLGRLRLGGAWPDAPAAFYVFRAPRSYTGEDMVEVHTLGLTPLLAATSRALALHGARGAGPGEFTRRAFLNGRLDLTQAEAVLALTSGERSEELRLATRSLQGGLRESIDAIKTPLIELAAFIEAGIDFSEDEVELLPVEDVIARLERARAELDALEARCAQLRLFREAPVVALAGAANAGKSTLLNRLVGQRRVLTSDQAGTTRDVVETLCALPRLTIRLLDLAGDKAAADEVEQAALEQARVAEEGADLVLRVVDARSDGAHRAALEPRELLVWSQCDRLSQWPEPTRGVAISALTGRGIDALIAAVEARLLEGQGEPAVTGELATTSRQLERFDAAREALEQATATMREAGEERWELGMIDLRDALDALGEVTGAVATEDILDLIFSSFCIGK